MRSSMNGKGNRWDNAPTESFRGRLKTVGAHGRKFATREQAGQAAMDRMAFHNHRRLHSSPGCISPMRCEKRRREAQRKKAAQTVGCEPHKTGARSRLTVATLVLTGASDNGGVCLRRTA